MKGDIFDDPVNVPDPGEVAEFMAWINRVRGDHGLSTLSYDSELSESAFLNNKEQHVKGLGHWVKPADASQCVGDGDFSQVTSMWMASPPHFVILMGPRMTRVGFDHYPPFFTVNLASR